MSRTDDMIRRCVTVCPDFRIGLERDPKHGNVMRADCTLEGRSLTLALTVPFANPNDAQVREAMDRVLDGCVASLEHRWEQLRHGTKP